MIEDDSKMCAVKNKVHAQAETLDILLLTGLHPKNYNCYRGGTSHKAGKRELCVISISKR